MNASLPRRSATRRLSGLLLVLLLHALLLGLLLRPRVDMQPASASTRIEPGMLLRLLPLPPKKPRAGDAGEPITRQPARAASNSGAPAPAATGRTRAAADQPPLRDPTIEALPVPPAEPSPAPAAITQASPAASVAPLLLNSEGTQRAIRQATRTPLLSERAASASQDPGRLNSQQRMAQEMERAAHGDCLKGEFTGAGLGLLSLPFWALAEARGKCRR